MGHTLHKLGIALNPLHRQDMTPKRIAKRISKVISSKSMPEKARALGQKINMEDSLTAAVKMIEAFASDKGILMR